MLFRSTRVPDLFHDFPPYVLSESEEKRFATLWTNALAVGKQMRAAHPDVRLLFGNGPLPTKEEFFRRKLPPEIFDAAGNEALGSPSLPETQPPNWLGNNSSLWMDRQMLDAYGYGAKAIDQCHEVCYPSTNPGNLDPATQADYFVRHAIHSLAWGVPAFRPGILTDVGVGLRLGNNRSALGNVLHVDLAMPLQRERSIEALQFVIETKRSF